MDAWLRVSLLFGVVAGEHGLFVVISARNGGVPIRRTRGVTRERVKMHLAEECNRRTIVEAVHFVVKRKSGSFARSRILGQLEKEIALKMIAYNIVRISILNGSKLVFIIEVFFLQN